MDAKGIINSVFGVPRALIGVIHVAALPGTPGSRRSVAEYRGSGRPRGLHVRSCRVSRPHLENTHDRPYLNGSVGPRSQQLWPLSPHAVRRSAKLAVGVQILAGANSAAMAVASRLRR